MLKISIKMIGFLSKIEADKAKKTSLKYHQIWRKFWPREIFSTGNKIKRIDFHIAFKAMTVSIMCEFVM